MRRAIALATAAALAALGFVAAGSGAPKPKPALHVVLPRAGDLTLEVVKVTIPVRRKGLRFRLVDPKRKARNARIVTAVRTTHVGKSTTFRILVIARNGKRAARSAGENGPGGKHESTLHVCVDADALVDNENNDNAVVLAQLLVGFDLTRNSMFSSSSGALGATRIVPCAGPGCPHCPRKARVESATLLDLLQAIPSERDLFSGDAQKLFGSASVDLADPSIDTGHYDDGHALGWKKPDEQLKIDWKELGTSANLDPVVAEMEQTLNEGAGVPTTTTATTTTAPTTTAPVACTAIAEPALVTQASNVTYTFEPAQLRPAKVGQTYITTVTVSGGKGPYAWGVADPNKWAPGIPPPVGGTRVVGPSITIRGTPTQAGDFTAGLDVFDQGNGAGAAVHYTLRVCP
jgi:hypothetical protein